MASDQGTQDFEERDEEAAARMGANRWSGLVLALYGLKAAMKLGVPNILAHSGALSAKEIAKLIHTNSGAPADPVNLERILRCLAAHDLVKESTVDNGGWAGGTSERKYEASPVLRYLIDDDNVSRGTFGPTLAFNLGVFPLLDSLDVPVVDNSRDPCYLVTGKPFFEYVVTSPGLLPKFRRAAAGHSNLYMSMILEKYHGFKRVKTLVDVGGGIGMGVACIVAKYPNIRGINFDQPKVIASFPAFSGVENVGGNIFESIPECDAAFMKMVLHDWNDENCVKILKTIAKALSETGKIINVDILLPEITETTFLTQVDLASDLMVMIASPGGGRERTLAQFRELGLKSGFPRVVFAAAVDNLSVLEFYKK